MSRDSLPLGRRRLCSQCQEHNTTISFLSSSSRRRQNIYYFKFRVSNSSEAQLELNTVCGKEQAIFAISERQSWTAKSRCLTNLVFLIEQDGGLQKWYSSGGLDMYNQSSRMR